MNALLITLIVMVSSAILAGIFYFILYSWIMWNIEKHPDNNPYDYYKKMNENSNHDFSKKRIVFIGDSITQGNLSANYIDLLITKLGSENYDYINAGLNSELAYNVNKRMNSIIACKPNFVTIMIGTNDAHREIELFDDSTSDDRLNLPQKPTFEWYQENLEEIISKLQEKTEAAIALCSLPPLGEDQTTRVFQQAVNYSKIIEEIASEFDVTYLPVNEVLIDFLNNNPSNPKHPMEYRVLKVVTLKRLLLRQSFDKISLENGFSLLTDHIHLNTKGALIIADLIEKFITNQNLV